ncbi:bifunctional proline dehydrogenase/L-glutamate gamma-semialdehyde dehydrogenase [Ruania suaedae]|uniref:bifunctional proline dehydrogenase/L-glutamate gamma-semialdehyde dehydrogenase n=1 Tax=Ruania suaedae TaxID=2897774 RepID=UPI003F49AE57
MADVTSLVDPAVELAHRWADAASQRSSSSESRTSARLAALVGDPRGLDLAVRFVDRVARPEDPVVAARELARLSTEAASGFLSGPDRAMLGLGSAMAPLAPSMVVPLARHRLRQLVGHLVVDASDPALAHHLAQARAHGRRSNINLLGEAVLGEQEASTRAARTRQLLERDDVDHVSVKVSSLVSQLSTWDTEAAVARVVDRLRPLYRTAARTSPAAFVNLDMEEHRHLDLTVAVFEAICGEPEFRGLEMGLALQAYVPESQEAMERLIAFARRRRAAGGAPIKIRLVKGANLAMERVEAELHGWVQAPYASKAEVDAAYVRMMDRLLHPDVAGAVRTGVASHNLFDLALAHHLASSRGVEHALDVEMLQGMAPAQARAVARDVCSQRPLILYTPVVAAQDFDVAVSYLVRRLEENAEPENFLRAILADAEPAAMAGQESRFRAAVRDSPTVDGSSGRAGPRPPAGPAFVNTSDSDPSSAEVRRAAREWVSAPARELTSPELVSAGAVEETAARALLAQPDWAARGTGERAAVLRSIADELEARRPALVTQAAHEGGKTVAESDPEVSEAIDFARYYADRAQGLDELADLEGLTFTPDRLVLVTPPWNFPIAIPAGGVLAALAAGAAAILKPAPQVPGCAELVVEAVHAAFAAHRVPDELVQVVRTDEAATGRQLVAHPDVDRVILTGSHETAQLFTRWRSDRPAGSGVLAETSGKNALVVTASADVDLAVSDVLRSAFGHAGQKCSAASLLILVGSMARSERFHRQLLDAVGSLRVGRPEDLGTAMGPLIAAPEGKLAEALTRLEPGESWLLEPRRRDDEGRLFSPGIKTGVRPGSPFHLTEYFGPVLGIMVADSLEQAIEWQNAPAFGLTGGLHSLDEDEIRHWLAHVEVGNAYVNRHTTGAIVRRQPFGGWKRSSVGPGAKAGGPNYVAQLGTWSTVQRPWGEGAVGRRVRAHLEAVRRLAEDPAEEEWLWVSALSDGAARDEIYSRESDPTGLTCEANLLRYRPVPGLTVRASAGAVPVEIARMVLAAACAGVPAEVSMHPEVAAVVEARVGPDAVGWGWSSESDEDFETRVEQGQVSGRVRVIGIEPGLVRAAASAASEAILLHGEVLASGRRELLTLLREQAISQTRHRFGHLEHGRGPDSAAPEFDRR